ncbi:alpha-xylosidase, partial [Cronobacter sakazakii]|nr:alpha-xylosidase [Cronobacter sakazakii]
LPPGRWTHLWHNDELDGGRWHRQRHDFLSLPVYVRDNTLLALGNNDQKPDYVWHEGTAFQLFNLADGAEARCEVPAANGETTFTLCAKREGKRLMVEGRGHATGWTLCLRNIQQATSVDGASITGSEWGVLLTPEREARALIITL